MLGSGGRRTGCCELRRGGARSRTEFREGLPRASAPHREAAAARGRRSAGRSPTRGKGRVGAGTSSPLGASTGSRARRGAPRPDLPACLCPSVPLSVRPSVRGQPDPGQALPLTSGHGARGSGRGSLPPPTPARGRAGRGAARSRPAAPTGGRPAPRRPPPPIRTRLPPPLPTPFA